MTKIIINGQVRDMTSAEETQLTEDRKIMAAQKKIRDDERTAKANNKTSGKQKLLDLGLSEEEVKALIRV
jgi:hypothetical protein